MPPFDRAHTTSCSTLVETMRLSCTVFDILQPAFCQKSPILTYPTCIGRPRWGWPRWNFAEIFGIRLFSCVAILVEHRLVTDTDRQTQDRSIYRASIASRGNKNRVVICMTICLVQNLCMVWPMPLPSQIPASLASLKPTVFTFHTRWLYVAWKRFVEPMFICAQRHPSSI